MRMYCWSLIFDVRPRSIYVNVNMIEGRCIEISQPFLEGTFSSPRTSGTYVVWIPMHDF